MYRTLFILTDLQLPNNYLNFEHAIKILYKCYIYNNIIWQIISLSLSRKETVIRYGDFDKYYNFFDNFDSVILSITHFTFNTIIFGNNNINTVENKQN